MLTNWHFIPSSNVPQLPLSGEPRVMSTLTVLTDRTLACDVIFEFRVLLEHKDQRAL